MDGGWKDDAEGTCRLKRVTAIIAVILFLCLLVTVGAAFLPMAGPPFW